ncbi:hypothetical protein [uncultured Maricaulis sp.]|uniref:hypothetical protein n=1 Tax=uncultured Maricaulis sp. TaxID=174710 RepID=UPI0026257BC7|nr:hypothetical protein [uncultured Maricaulis sp.]
MAFDCSDHSPAAADHARIAVSDWLETQARVIGYWRDVLVSSGGNLALIEALDDHARFLAAAAHQGEGDFLQTQ